MAVWFVEETFKKQSARLNKLFFLSVKLVGNELFTLMHANLTELYIRGVCSQ